MVKITFTFLGFFFLWPLLLFAFYLNLHFLLSLLPFLLLLLLLLGLFSLMTIWIPLHPVSVIKTNIKYSYMYVLHMKESLTTFFDFFEPFLPDFFLSLFFFFSSEVVEGGTSCETIRWVRTGRTSSSLNGLRGERGRGERGRERERKELDRSEKKGHLLIKINV